MNWTTVILVAIWATGLRTGWTMKTLHAEKRLPFQKREHFTPQGDRP